MSVRFNRDGATTKNFQTMLPMLAPDSYTVHWKAMGEDGHMMKGSYGFMQH
ncbi:copper resistance protein CopC [Marinomonas foliarum]|uniref:Copper resistance protein CopC n=1 Tax=Marinomonas foliarum TaxID=491950 RepID=A0ABX7IM71_9GAMM|nr:copper resistance protein CopC [Marinomonas foliarum]